MTFIHRSEITKERWTDTSRLRTDGKEEFREKAKYGNRHAVFVKGALLGEVHYDQYNVTDIPVGTINHASTYVEEKTGIPKGLVALGIVLVGAFVTIKALTYITKKF